MKQLILVRHAKSSWDGFQTDFDRQLAPRGIQDARKIAHATRALIHPQDAAFSSNAQRARHTAEIFTEVYELKNLQLCPALYTFEEAALEHFIRNLDPQLSRAILFGHNEAITNFVNKFGDVYIPNVSTSGFVMLEFSAQHWSDISPGKTIQVLFPKDLA